MSEPSRLPESWTKTKLKGRHIKSNEWERIVFFENFLFQCCLNLNPITLNGVMGANSSNDIYRAVELPADCLPAVPDEKVKSYCNENPCHKHKICFTNTKKYL